MDYFEAEELAIAALGLPEDSDDDCIEDALYKRFEIDLSQFKKIAEVLLPLTIPARTAITGEMCKGFVKDEDFIVKEET